MAYAPGKGTILQLEIASVFTAIAQLVNVTPPSMSVGTSETTHLASTWREFIGSIPDGGEITFTIEYDSADASHAALSSKFAGCAVENWKVLFNDAGDTEVAFSGIITGFSWDEVVIDNVVTASLTVKVSGTVTVTP